MMKNSPWAISGLLLNEDQHGANDNQTDRAFRAVISALSEVCGPRDSSADVLQGVAEALCFLYIELLDPCKVKSMEEAKKALLSDMDRSYDLVLRARCIMERRCALSLK